MSVTIDGSTGITLPDSGALSTSIGDAINITSGYVSGIQLGGTGSANKLDDYEEGTWTPIFTRNGNTTDVAGSYSIQIGQYTKVGNLVTVYFDMQSSSISTVSAGFVSISGLPFASISNRYSVASFRDYTALTASSSTRRPNMFTNNGSYIYIQQETIQNGSTNSIFNWDSSGRVNGQVTYYTNS